MISSTEPVLKDLLRIHDVLADASRSAAPLKQHRAEPPAKQQREQYSIDDPQHRILNESLPEALEQLADQVQHNHTASVVADLEVDSETRTDLGARRPVARSPEAVLRPTPAESSLRTVHRRIAPTLAGPSRVPRRDELASRD